MIIREINRPITSASLNETLAKKYGTRIDTDKFTLEQLQDARNKIRTKLSDIETNESYGGLHKNQTYSKNKLFLDVLNAAISERSDVEEAAKPDYIDIDGDGDKKEPMKKALKDKKKKPVGEDQVDEFMGVDSEDEVDLNLQKAIQKRFGTKPVGDIRGRTYGDGNVEIDDPAVQMMLDAGILTLNPEAEKAYNAISPEKRAEIRRRIDRFQADKAQQTDNPNAQQTDNPNAQKAPGSLFDLLGDSIIREGEEDKAELVMASKDMVDRLTGWMEDTAEMQSESMLELADAIRDEMGQQQADAFVNTVKPALEQLYAAMEGTRTSLTTGVGMLTGEGEAPAPDMGAADAEAEAAQGVELDTADMEPTVDQDEFGAAAAAAGGTDEAGRARRESRMYKKKAMLEQSRRLGVLLSKKK